MNSLQRTEEWFNDRLSMVTASNFKAVLAKGQGKTRKAYMLRLLAERVTGQVQETYHNQFMQDGTDREESSIKLYEFITGRKVNEIGFVLHPKYKEVGCSPDGLVDNDGLVECKNPLATTHIEYLLAGKAPSTYKPQIQGQLWVTGRDWCDFVSCYPRMKPLIVRVYPDKEYIKNLEKEVIKFVAELDELYARIQ